MAAQKPKIEDFDRVLVVEGYSDLLFYAEILGTLGKHELVFIKELGGRSGLDKKFEDFITPSLLARKTAIAFIFDADENPAGTQQSLEQLLTQLTGQHIVNNQWTAGAPRIGLLIVPGAGTKGEIETLVWQSWASDPVNAAQKKCVEDYVACMRGDHATAHSPDKGLIGALLAIRSDEDPRLGPGARAKVFNLNSPQLQALRNFLAAF
jgi:hypothetical protein